MDNHQENKFSYTYSAKEQNEIKKIRDKYAPAAEDKMVQLRRLDAGVTKKGTMWSLVMGVIGTVVMGGGMSMCMVGPEEYFIPGILLGIVGMIPVIFAYPLYTHITKKEREKIAPEILRLTDELMK